MPLPSPIRILLANDHAVGRMGLSAILSLDVGLQIVAEAEDGVSTLEQYRLHLPDVVLMDLKIPEPSGISILKRLKGDFPEAKVLVLATLEHTHEMRSVREAGASGYLSKSAPRAELVLAIKAIHAGKLHPSLTAVFE